MGYTVRTREKNGEYALEVFDENHVRVLESSQSYRTKSALYSDVLKAIFQVADNQFEIAGQDGFTFTPVFCRTKEEHARQRQNQ